MVFLRRSLLLTTLLLLWTLPTTATIVHVPADEPTIQDGVDAASEGDTVMVACDTYYLTDAVVIDGADITLRSATGEAGCATIDGQNASHGFRCVSCGSSTTIMGFTFRNCVNALGGIEGSALTVTGSPDLLNLVFHDNSGGFGTAHCGMGAPTFTNVIFTDNSGSALYVSGGDPVLTDVVFELNHGGAGAGMQCQGGEAYLEDVEFKQNTSSGNGGGLFLDGASVTLVDVTFYNNYADGKGGGVYGFFSSTPSFEDVEFLGNYAGDDGGGMFCHDGCVPTLTDVVFHGNRSSGGGGGMACLDVSPDLSHVTFDHNDSVDPGGGFRADGTASPTLQNVTLAHNDTFVGAGVYCAGTSHVTMENCIVAFSDYGPGVECGTTASATVTCTDVYGNAGGDWIDCISSQYGSNGNVSLDPLFCDNQNPYTPYALQDDSPCLSGGVPGCDLIGAWGQGCPAGTVVPDPATAEATWGVLKWMYRR